MEYILLFIEYHVLRKGNVIKNLIMPIIIGICVFFFTSSYCHYDTNDLCNNLTNVLGILIGFSISIFAILLSVENDNIRDAKKEMTNAKLYSKPVSLFDALLVDIAYSIIIQGLLLIVNIFSPFFINTSRTFMAIDTACITYVVVLILRCVLDMYFILTKKNKNKAR